MTVTQYITVRTPPGRDYVAWATMPFPRGTDPRTIGNSLSAVQQWRRFGRLAEWDIYKWCVAVPGGTQQVVISDDYAPPRGEVGGSTGKIRPSDGSPTPPSSVPNQRDPLIPPSWWFSNNVFRLRIVGWNGVEEFVDLAGQRGRVIDSGPLKLSFMLHIRTQNFGSFHAIWEFTWNDPYARLVLNWHTGIPAPELIFQYVRVVFDGGIINWSSEFQDPAIDSGSSYLVKPNTNGHLFPRMAQRPFCLLVYPRSSPYPGTGAFTQDPGWGIGQWGNGGFGATDLHVPSLSYIIDLGSRVVNDAVRTEQEFFNLENDWDSSGDANATSTYGAPPPGGLWAPWGQQYGGPTGSDQHYKPNNGIRTVASNRREGLMYHKVLRVRNHCREWNAIYEPDGSPVSPEEHLDSNGNAQWEAFIAGSPPNMFKPEQGSSRDPYGLWKDEGFNFDQFSARMIPPTGQRPYELQSTAVPTSVQRWDCWDGQHRMLLFQDDIALAWLAADPLSIMYLVQNAEVSRMCFWAGSGAANRLNVPATAGIGVTWGRDVMWNMYAIASAAPFVLEHSPLTDEDGTSITPSARKSRWAEQELKVFIQGTEKAMMASGIAWHLAATGKVFDAAPFLQNYWVLQIFEVAYGMSALRACFGAFGDYWTSLLDPGRSVDINGLIRDFARALDQFTWLTKVTVASFAVNAAGTGYTTGEIAYLVSDDHYTQGGGNPLVPGADAQVGITAVAGAVTVAAVNNAGIYFTEPYAPTKTYSLVNAPTISVAGSGYAANQYVTVGDPLLALPQNIGKPGQTMRVKITSVNGTGGVTGIQLDRVGKYFTPPTSPAAAIPDGGSQGTGLVLGFTRSCGGSGLTVTPTWTAPVETGSASWKVIPVGPFPNQGNPPLRYVTRGEFDPIDIVNQTVTTVPYSASSLGAQTSEKVALLNAVGYFGYAGALEGWLLLTQITGLGDAGAAINAIKNSSGGLEYAGAKLENFWPLLSFYELTLNVPNIGL